MISIKCILLFIDEAGLARDNDNPVNIHIFLFFSPWTNAPSTKVRLANLNIYSCLLLCTICVVMITNSASTGLLLNNQFIFVYKISQFSSARGMAALVGSLFASITDYSAQNTRKPQDISELMKCGTIILIYTNFCNTISTKYTTKLNNVQRYRANNTYSNTIVNRNINNGAIYLTFLLVQLDVTVLYLC